MKYLLVSISITAAFLFPPLTFAEETASPVTVSVVLNPMGDFKAKTSEIKGSAKQKGDEFTAENIVVNLTNLKTGIDMRDKHVKKYLQTEKFPEAILLTAQGKGGNGTGKIKIKGIEKNIKGTYKIEGSNLIADFPLLLSDFGITDVSYMGITTEDEVKLHIVVPVTK